eukprot:scaffold42824_cov161-Skeletonema_dohrnii-CCMP3373.AAC.3
MTRAISDGYQGLRSSQHSSHSASWSESATYTRTKKRRETAVNRMNNGVLASNKSTNRISMDSTSSASDSNIQFSLRSTELSRSITSSHSNQNQEQQQQQLESPTNNNDESDDNNNQVDRNNGHEDNNMGEENQIQQKPFFTRCCSGWQYVLACSPMKRYKKRSSAITTLENQYFIPPPEENTTFIESIMYTMNGYGQDFVVWIYQASFFAVLVICLTAYYALVFAFAGVVVAMERASDGRCNFVTETLMSSESVFELAFELSWTTFTTVGYGQVAPSGEDCYPIRVGCSFFAFMGLLFNSLSAAIFFSKLERVLTKASVTFSSSICLQFNTVDADRGARVDSYRKMGFGLRSVEGEAFSYPFLEFRIINDHANHKSRAVRNASCAALVSLSGKHAELISGEAQQSSELYKEFVTKSFSMDVLEEASPKNTTGNSTTPRTASKKPSFYSAAKAVMKTNASVKSIASATAGFDQDESGEPTPSQEERADASAENVDPPRRARPSARITRMVSLSDSIKQTAIIVQENDNGKGQQATPEGRVYFPLELEPSTNPYMSRVWYLRHTLNEKSPLLRYSVREKLKRDGVWDAELNTYQDIIASLVDFHKIRVTFKGTSSASNSLLFTQKVCEYIFI